MEKELRRKWLKTMVMPLCMLVFMCIGIMISSIEVEAAGTTYDLGQGYTMRLDNPGMGGKNYYHIHFYYGISTSLS